MTVAKAEHGYMATHWEGDWHICATAFDTRFYTWARCHARSDKWNFWMRKLPPGRSLCVACQTEGQGLFASQAAAQTSAAQEGSDDDGSSREDG